MLTTLKLGWRSIWRNRRRTLTNVAAVGFGLLLTIFFTGLLGGMIGGAKDEMDNTGMGHVEIYATGYRVKHDVRKVLADPTALVAGLHLPEGSQVSARVVARGLLATAWGSRGVRVHGIDPATEATVSSYLTDLRQGERLEAGDARGMLIGEKLAERLKVKPGSKVRLMVQRADGEMGADLFRVRGVFHSMAAAISESLVVVTTDAARAVIGIGDAVHQVVIQIPVADQADLVRDRLRADLGDQAEVLSYGDLLPMLRQMESLIGAMLAVMSLFVYALVGLGILNTITMSVMERTREFGVMMAIGTRPRRIVGLVLAESFWIGTISAAAGLALGLLLTWVGSRISLFDFSAKMGESFDMGGSVMATAFRTEFSVAAALQSCFLVYVLTLVVGLYPAWKVSRMQAAEALRRV